jgi:hypothetical protein
MGKSTREQIEGSVNAATWLTEADAGAVSIAYRLADELDAAVEVGDLVQLSKALQGMLTALGMTVAGRVGKAEPDEEVNPLDALRKRAAKTDRRKSASTQSGPTGI